LVVTSFNSSTLHQISGAWRASDEDGPLQAISIVDNLPPPPPSSPTRQGPRRQGATLRRSVTKRMQSSCWALAAGQPSSSKQRAMAQERASAGARSRVTTSTQTRRGAEGRPQRRAKGTGSGGGHSAPPGVPYCCCDITICSQLQSRLSLPWLLRSLISTPTIMATTAATTTTSSPSSQQSRA